MQTAGTDAHHHAVTGISRLSLYAEEPTFLLAPLSGEINGSALGGDEQLAGFFDKYPVASESVQRAQLAQIRIDQLVAPFGVAIRPSIRFHQRVARLGEGDSRRSIGIRALDFHFTEGNAPQARQANRVPARLQVQHIRFALLCPHRCTRPLHQPFGRQLDKVALARFNGGDFFGEAILDIAFLLRVPPGNFRLFRRGEAKRLLRRRVKQLDGHRHQRNAFGQGMGNSHRRHFHAHL